MRRALVMLLLLHAYVGWRLIPDVPCTEAAVAVGAWLFASLVLIPVGYSGRRSRRQPLADRLAWAGYLAMGGFSTLFVLTFARDLVLLVATVLDYWPLENLPLDALFGYSAVAVPALAALLTLIGLVNARRRARVRTVDIPIADLPPALHGFTIVQITDVHVGPTIKRGYVESIVDSVNALGADMIALTGDLVDGSVHHLAHHTEPFSRLAARHGLSSSRATTSTTPARTRGSRSCAASACACC
jgi:hypothetical protein